MFLYRRQIGRNHGESSLLQQIPAMSKGKRLIEDFYVSEKSLTETQFSNDNNILWAKVVIANVVKNNKNNVCREDCERLVARLDK